MRSQSRFLSLTLRSEREACRKQKHPHDLAVTWHAITGLHPCVPYVGKQAMRTQHLCIYSGKGALLHRQGLVC